MINKNDSNKEKSFLKKQRGAFFMIEFRNVSKLYDTGTEAVHDATFTIDKGEFAFLVGASGSRKIDFN